MNLSYLVMQFVNRARKSPADATDPRILGRLEQVAQEGFDGSAVALHAPVAPLTWEAKALMAGASAANPTTRVPLTFPRPIEIVGMLPIVVPTTSTAGLVTPTVDDIEVALDLNLAEYSTSGQGLTSAANPNPTGQFVTLSGLSVNTPRLLMWKLTAPKPEVGFTFRGKRGNNVYQDALISVICMCRYLGRPGGQ